MSDAWPGPSEEQLRAELAATSQALHARGWVANHDGNVSARLTPSRLLCTPTATSKGDVTAAMLLILDEAGAVLSGSRRPFSEMHLHRAAYSARPDIGVVLHAHPPAATAFAVTCTRLDPTIMAEPIVSLGAVIPMVPFSRPKAPALDRALAEALAHSDVVLLEQHGVLTVGGSCEQALLRMELVEHIARISLKAMQLGGARTLEQSVVEALSARGRPPSVPCFSQTVPQAKPARPASTVPALSARPDVQGLIRDAWQRFQ
jgi:L-fuculose-phosphate aldolase